MNTKAFLNKIKEAIRSVDETAEVILFGSRARGDNKQDSDWDILVLTDKEDNYALLSKMTDKVYDIELEYEQAVSKIIIDRPRWDKMSITGFYENVIRDGIAL